MAEMLGCDEDTLCMYERGEANLTDAGKTRHAHQAQEKIKKCDAFSQQDESYQALEGCYTFSPAHMPRTW